MRFPLVALRASRVGLLVWFSLAGVNAVRADDPKPTADPAKEADALFTELKSDSFQSREAARAKLAALAPRIRSQLEAHRDDADPEVRRIVLGLLAGLGISSEPMAALATLSSTDLVTFHAEGTLPEVLARLDRVAEGRVRLPPSAAEAHAKVDAEALPYFQVLDQLLGDSRLELADGFDAAGQATASARESSSASPTAYAGPFRLDIESVSTTKLFKGAGRARITLLLRLLWAPSVQVVTYAAPTSVSATDSAGTALVATDQGNLIRPADPSHSTASFTVSFEPAGDSPPDRVERLELGVRLRLRRGKASVVFDHPVGAAFPVKSVFHLSLPAPDAPVLADVTLEQFGPDSDRTGWWLGAVSARLPLGVTPECFSAALESSDGLLRPMTERASRISGADGSVRLTLRALPLAQGAEPRAVRASCYAREDEIPVSFVVTGIPLR